MKPRLAALALLLVPMAACATKAPEPCTAEWIDYKTDKVLRKFASENRGMINSLRRLAKEDGDIDPFVAIELTARSGQLQKFADSFNDIVLPELEAALDQCGSREEFIPAFTKFLKQEGVSDEAMEWIVPFVGLMQSLRSDPATTGKGA